MRPRQFDEAALLHAAFDQFWRRGVRGASLSDIARAANIQRGSLYNAYGGKDALFLKAYAAYATTYLDTLDAAMADGDLRTRLDSFFEAAIKNFSAGDRPRGCPTTRGLMELTTDGERETSDAARDAFADMLNSIKERLAATFQRGAREGEFGGDPHVAAELILSVARGMVVIDSAFEDTARLQRLARNAIDMVLDGPGAG